MELEQKIAELKQKDIRKILFLPKGRVRSVEPPEMEFEVTEETVLLLNNYAVCMFDLGKTPWLDLMHDAKSRIFNISNFAFEDEGVFCYGQFTPLGRNLYETGRISGISITTPVVKNNGKFYDATFCQEISAEEVSSIGKSPPHDLSLMGAVLVDGKKSAIQPA